MTSPSNKPESCECCYYLTDKLVLSYEGPKQIKRLWLCELCRSSLAGTAAIYADASTAERVFIAGVIMNATNHILRALATKEGVTA